MLNRFKAANSGQEDHSSIVCESLRAGRLVSSNSSVSEGWLFRPRRFGSAGPLSGNLKASRTNTHALHPAENAQRTVGRCQAPADSPAHVLDRVPSRRRLRGSVSPWDWAPRAAAVRPAPESGASPYLPYAPPRHGRRQSPPVADRVQRLHAEERASVVLRRDGSIDWLEPSGAPVGLYPEAIWQERVVRLQPGDRVLAYTDGVTEASSPSEKELGVEGLLQAANGCRLESAPELVRSILDSMDDFSGGVQTDDATLVALRAI